MSYAGEVTSPLDARIDGYLRPGTLALYAPAILGWGTAAFFLGFWVFTARPAPGLEAMAAFVVLGSGFLAPCLIVSQCYAILGVLQFPAARRAGPLLLNFSPTLATLLFLATA